MSDNIRLSLEPSTVALDPGGEAASTVLTIQNLGQVVDQYAIQVEGLDPSWFTLPVTGVALFPQDRNEVRLTIHPPKRDEAKAGDYPFTIKVLSRALAGESTSISGLVKVQPLAVFKAEINPQRVRTRRQGNFRLALANAGNTDLILRLSGVDREEACRISFSDGEPVIGPNEKRNVSLTVRPNRSGLIGKPKSYDFTVTVAPQGGRGDAKVLSGYLMQKPLLESWSPLLGCLKTAVILIILVLGCGLAVILGGGISGWQRTAGGLWDQARSGVQPILNGKLPSLGSQGKPIDLGFREARSAAPELVGDPTEDEQADSAGNVHQNTSKGHLFWFKATNTVYFFDSKAVYVFRDRKPAMIDKAR